MISERKWIQIQMQIDASGSFIAQSKCIMAVLQLHLKCIFVSYGLTNQINLNIWNHGSGVAFSEFFTMNILLLNFFSCMATQ